MRKKSKSEEGKPYHVRVIVKKGRNLPAMDAWAKSSDPYVVVKVGSDEQQTPHAEKNLNPDWNSTLDFFLAARPKGILFNVKDRDTQFSLDDPLGHADLDLDPLWMSGSLDFFENWLPLKAHSSTVSLHPECAIYVRVECKVKGENVGLGQTSSSPTAAKVDPSKALEVKKLLEVKKERAFLGFIPQRYSLFVVIGFILWAIIFGKAIVCDAVGFLYPLYASFKAVRSPDKDDDTQWLIYWVFFGFFTIVEAFFQFFISFIPGYYYIKLGLLFFAFWPSIQGAKMIYDKFLNPMFKTWEKSVDEKILILQVAFARAKADALMKAKLLG